MNNLAVSPGSPLILRAAVDAVLVLHITGGLTGITSGFAALVLRKGSRGHQIAGDTFVVAMLVMSTIGALASPFLPQPQRANVVPGLLTFYLVLTAWMTARRREGGTGRFEVAAMVFAVAACTLGLSYGFAAQAGPKGLLDGEEASTYFVYAAFPGMAALFDFSVILRRGVTGAQRLARHVWRTCFALFIATASLFLGQPKVFPPGLRGSPVMFLPELLILGAMLFWLIRLAVGAIARRVRHPRPSLSPIHT